MRIVGAALLPIAIVGVVAGCSSPSGDKPAAAGTTVTGPAAVTQARMNKGTADPNQWPTYGGSYNEQRFSPLTAINDSNVAQLGLAWYGDYDSNQNQHGSPLYADGVIYVSASRNHLYAFDARTGKRLWNYAPV